MAARSVIEVLKAIATLDVSGWMASAAKISSSSAKMRADWMKAAKDISTAVDRIGMATAALVAGTATVGFKFNSMAEQAEIAFTTMMGDAGKARAHLKALFDYAAKTPFNAEGVIDASRKLQAMGIAADDVLPTLSTLSDAVAGLGGGTPMLDRVVRAIGQMKARGKVSAEEMMQLAENGIPAWQMLAEQMGISMAEAMDRGKAGAISADEGITAILDGLQKKFGGMSAKQAETFSGMLSTLKDMAEMGAGEITKPLFTAFTRWTTQLTDMASKGGFAEFTTSMKVAVQDFVMAVERRLPAAIAQFKEMAPAIGAAFASFGQFIAQLSLFMVEHPRVLAALIALKVAGFLGVNAAIMSTLKALASTVAYLFNVTQAGTKLIAVLRAIGVALATMSTGALATMNLAFLAIVVVVGKWYQALQDVNRELEKGQRLTNAMLKLDEKRHQQRMKQIEEMNAPDRKAALEGDISNAEKNMASKRGAVEAARAELDSLNPLHNATGEITAAKQKLAENIQALEMAERHLADMQALLDQTTKDLANKKPFTPQGPQLPAGAPGAPAAGGFVDKDGNVVTFDQALQAEMQNREKQAFQDKVKAAADAASAPAGPQMPENFEAAHQQVNDAKDSLREMAGAMQLTTTQTNEFFDALDKARDETINGKMTMDEFANALKQVKLAADQAAAAAAAEAEQKRIEALIKGDWKGAGLDFQKAVQERQAAIQLGKFNDAVEEAARAALGLSNATTKAAKKMDPDMAQSGGFGGGGGGGMSSQDAFSNLGKAFEGGNTLFNFLRSTQGQLASLQWNLQIAQRNLALAKGSGGVMGQGFGADKVRFWEQMIQQLIQQMHDLVTAPQLFKAFTGEDPAPMDPTLQAANDPSRIGTVTLSFPNVNRISQADAELIYRAVKDAGRRLGDSSDFIRGTRT